MLTIQGILGHFEGIHGQLGTASEDDNSDGRHQGAAFDQRQALHARHLLIHQPVAGQLLDGFDLRAAVEAGCCGGHAQNGLLVESNLGLSPAGRTHILLFFDFSLLMRNHQLLVELTSGLFPEGDTKTPPPTLTP